MKINKITSNEIKIGNVNFYHYTSGHIIAKIEGKTGQICKSGRFMSGSTLTSDEKDFEKKCLNWYNSYKKNQKEV